MLKLEFYLSDDYVKTLDALKKKYDNHFPEDNYEHTYENVIEMLLIAEEMRLEKNSFVI